MIVIVCLVMLVKPIFPVFDYVVNYDYISQELCVNKEIKIMGCDGKCYLVKQLAKASDAEKPLSSDKKHVAEAVDIFLGTFNNYIFSKTDSNHSSAINSSYNNCYKSLIGSAYFHPPSIIS